MRLPLRAFLCAAFTLVSTATAGSAADLAMGDEGAWLGIFADPAGTQPCATVPQGTGATLYLVATLGGPVATGITAAEFRLVVTNPTGYFFNFVPPPDAPVVIGDPLDLEPANDDLESGVVVAFNDCQPHARVAVGTVQVFNASGGPTEIRVQRRSPSANANFACPLFVACDFPSFTLHCMRRCAADERGSGIVARLGLNQPGCAPKGACPAACPDAPCVQLAATISSPRCVGSPVTVTATATNCGGSAADIDVFIEETLAGTFTDVPGGQSVVASRTYTFQVCGGSFTAVSALATNAACPEPVGFEIQLNAGCSSSCGQNRPPDCTNAALSVTDLWPPDGRLVPMEVVGITDPDGDPITYRLFFGSDEWPGIEGVQCPDAFHDGANRFRLRAERNDGGDGRRYRVSVHAGDPHGAPCFVDLEICVPRKFGQACAPGLFPHVPSTCAPIVSDGPVRDLVAQALGRGAIQVTFETGAAADLRLDVYDVRGRRVSGLAQHAFAPGRHVLEWDGRDAAGREVANGIYVVSVQGDRGTRTAKAVLVR